MHLVLSMLAATTSVAVATSPRLASPYLDQLPQTLRVALVAKHQELDAENKKKRGGATNPFRLAENAAIILQHLRDKVPLRDIKLQDRQSASAAKKRWTEHINTQGAIPDLEGLSLPRMLAERCRDRVS